jgi:DNA-directed RNA polymerase alpha subunit
MSNFDHFQQIVGTAKILKLLQEVAKEAIDRGDWQKVRQITDFVEQIPSSSPDRPHPQPLSHLGRGDQEKEVEIKCFEVSLTSLNISSRCKELLQKAGLETVSDLQHYSLERLLEINGIGEVAAQQIDNALQEQGVILRSSQLRQRWQKPQLDLADSAFDENFSQLDATDTEMTQSEMRSPENHETFEED